MIVIRPSIAGRKQPLTTVSYDILTTKSVSPREYADLLFAVGWETQAPSDLAPYQRSLSAYPFLAHARTEQGELVGYVSAFCDGAFSTFLGELLVHPKAQRQGVGARLMLAVETYAGNVPVYVKPLPTARMFFEKLGYQEPSLPMAVLFKRVRKQE